MIHTFVALLTHKHESGHNRIVYRFLFVYLKRTGCGYIIGEYDIGFYRLPFFFALLHAVANKGGRVRIFC